MTWLGDEALARLRADLARPDLEGTRYTFVRTLGSGGMGVVHLVHDPALGRNVALKLLALPDGQADLEARLLREARVLARLEHPGIVPVHDVGTLADGRVYYTMKYIEGETLAGPIVRGLPLSDRLRLFLRVAETVAFAHAHGVLHRDLKPGNVMIGPFGEVLVLDWGLAKVLSRGAGEPRVPALAAGALEAPAPGCSAPEGGELEAREPPEAVGGPRPLTAHGSVLGTPGFMAPEQERGLRLDERADVFALGALLGTLIARGAANGGEGAAAAVPRALLAVSRKAAEPNPALRYPTATALAADVRRFLDREPVLAYREGLLERLYRTAARHKTALVLVATYLLLRVLLILRGAAG